MLFNSPEFLVFFAVVLALYFALPHRWQNRMLLVASYIFYGWWDWRFLILLAFTSCVDYSVGRALVDPRCTKHRRSLLLTSLTFNLGLLGFFKYFNFFADSFASACGALGLDIPRVAIDVVLPVGISFYTFQSMSYALDVYWGRLQPVGSFFDFLLYVSFFPQLVAGPINRACDLLPQMVNPRHTTLEQFYRGAYLILWGLAKKVVVADNLAVLVDRAFSAPQDLNALSAIVAVYGFAWQIYCDFSGYTDIARGCAAWMGVELQPNFRLPYFSSSPSEFWQRWHISLSSWLRDYLYIPLGGNRGSGWFTYRNLMITMLLGGLWHGAGWCFLIWGAYHGGLLCIYRALGKGGGGADERWSFAGLVHKVVFFHLVCVGWIFFRGATVTQCLELLHAFARAPVLAGSGIQVLALVVPFLLVEAFQYWRKDEIFVFRLAWPLRAAVYVCLYFALTSLGNWNSRAFIYFQF